METTTTTSARQPQQPHATAVRRLYDLAYGRAGDKGGIANVSVIARSPAAYAEIKARVTADCVRAHLGPLVRGAVERYELDTLEALNFVLHDALDGGATRSTRLDSLGKSLAGAVLYLPLPLEAAQAAAPHHPLARTADTNE